MSETAWCPCAYWNSTAAVLRPRCAYHAAEFITKPTTLAVVKSWKELPDE